MERGIIFYGFRSDFRHCASGQTCFPHETCEHALAQRISDKAEAAYQRGYQYEKRRTLIEAWTKFFEFNRQQDVAQLSHQEHCHGFR